jgi:CRISPR-associated protein Cmr4
MVTTNALITGIYTLTPTHVGTGRASSAVDLPIARDDTTDMPLLPATTLKGAARAHFGRGRRLSDDDLTRLFGSEIEARAKARSARSASDPSDDDKIDAEKPKTTPGDLVFHDATLLAYPARSLTQPFVHLTCPLILERLARLLRAHGHPSTQAFSAACGGLGQAPYVTDMAIFGGGQHLVVEGFAIERSRTQPSPDLMTIARFFGALLPPDEHQTAARLAAGLVLIDDATFRRFIVKAPPVAARVQLTSAKTSDNFGDEKGNLWYEETLPTDVLLAAFASTRRPESTALDEFSKLLESNRAIQFGGNETVGHGLCWWRANDGTT